MTSGAGRVAVLAAFVAVAVVLFVALQDDGSDDRGGDSTDATVSEQTTSVPAPPPEPPVEVIQMRDGAPVGGVRDLTYAKGDQIRIKVKLDEPQEDVHIHGYEEERLSPTEEATFDFPAKIEGIFELEAHGPDGDVVLAEIRVEPS